MKQLIKLVLFSFITLYFLGSCTVQKRRYNSGYHITWHHKNKSNFAHNSPNPNLSTHRTKTHRKSIKTSQLIEKINLNAFTKNFPTTQFTIANEPDRKKTSVDNRDIEMDLGLSYHQPTLDTQEVLTPWESDHNYYVNKHGKKVKYHRTLRLTLIIGGVILLLLGVVLATLILIPLGLSVLMTGLFLRHPKKGNHNLTSKQQKKAKTDRRVIAVILTIIGLGILFLLGIIILISLFFMF